MRNMAEQKQQSAPAVKPTWRTPTSEDLKRAADGGLAILNEQLAKNGEQKVSIGASAACSAACVAILARCFGLPRESIGPAIAWLASADSKGCGRNPSQLRQWVEAYGKAPIQASAAPSEADARLLNDLMS